MIDKRGMQLTMQECADILDRNFHFHEFTNRELYEAFGENWIGDEFYGIIQMSGECHDQIYGHFVARAIAREYLRLEKLELRESPAGKAQVTR